MFSEMATFAGSILVAGLALLSTLAAVMSPMMFDAPGSRRDPFVVAAFLSVLATPVTCVASILLAMEWIGGLGGVHPGLFLLLPLIPVSILVAAVMASKKA